MGAKASSMMTVDSNNFIPGMPVRPGPDWNEAPFPAAAYTVALGKSAPNTAVIRFANGVQKTVRAGADGKYDLEYAATGVPLTVHNFRAGAIVARNPVDWPASYGNQDNGGAGRAVALDGAWVRVKWVGGDGRDISENTYRAGADNKCDLLIFPELVPQMVPGVDATTPQPASAATTASLPQAAASAVIPEGCPVFFQEVVIGAKVTRGPDWPSRDPSGAGNDKGVIVATAPGQKVSVRWPDNTTKTYRCGPNEFDLIYAEQATGPTVTSPLAAPAAPSSGVASPTTAANGGEVISATNFRIGAKVVRGPDWRWGEQDRAHLGPGIVSGPLSMSPSGAWCPVTWGDNVTKNSYRIGADAAFDLRYYVEGSAPSASFVAATGAAGVPLNAVTATNFRPNAKVRRGPDWKFGEQDGGPGAAGTVLSIDGDNWVRVRWDNGRTNTYRAGVVDSGVTRFDIEYVVEGGVGSGSATAAASGVAPGVPLPTAPGAPGSIVRRDNCVIGAKVEPGPDWCWPQSQLASGPGTLVSIDAQLWARVKFPNGSVNSYRAGVTDNGSTKFDLVYMDPRKAGSQADNAAPAPAHAAATTTAPGSNGLLQQVVSRANFVAGAIVQRNPADWTWGEQDGGIGKTGRLVSIDDDQWARVQWDSGVSNSFRAGASGKFDMIYTHNPPRQHLSAGAAAAPAPKPGAKSVPAVAHVASPTTAPRSGDRVSRQNFQAGASVIPNPSPDGWKWGLQHGGKTGKLISIDSSDWIKVEFSGKINSYRAGGQSGGYDVIYGTVAGAASTAKPEPKPAATVEPTDNSEEACVVCLTNKKDHVFVPCGHVAACAGCAVELQKMRDSKIVPAGHLCMCPICREPAKHVIKIFK